MELEVLSSYLGLYRDLRLCDISWIFGIEFMHDQCAAA